MAYENAVEEILAKSANHRQFLHQYRRLAQKREMAHMDSSRDKFCPACSAELARHVVEWNNETLITCHQCGFWTKVSCLQDEGTLVTEGWRPRRRSPTVVLRADGSMKEIRDL